MSVPIQDYDLCFHSFDVFEIFNTCIVLFLIFCSHTFTDLTSEENNFLLVYYVIAKIVYPVIKDEFDKKYTEIGMESCETQYSPTSEFINTCIYIVHCFYIYIFTHLCHFL